MTIIDAISVVEAHEKDASRGGKAGVESSGVEAPCVTGWIMIRLKCILYTIGRLMGHSLSVAVVSARTDAEGGRLYDHHANQKPIPGTT